jgi:hypothetical protein
VASGAACGVDGGEQAGGVMPTRPRTKLYLRATIIFQSQQAQDGWLPRCTIVYGLNGQQQEEIIRTETMQATEQEADDVVCEIAERWIDEHNDDMTSFPWTTRTDDESKEMWHELVREQSW